MSQVGDDSGQWSEQLRLVQPRAQVVGFKIGGLQEPVRDVPSILGLVSVRNLRTAVNVPPGIPRCVGLDLPVQHIAASVCRQTKDSHQRPDETAFQDPQARWWKSSATKPSSGLLITV